MRRSRLDRITEALPRSRVVAGKYDCPYAEEGPLRRVFYVDVGTLPPDAANRFVNMLMKKYSCAP